MYLLKWKEKDWLIIRQSEIACNTMKKFQKSCLWYKKLVRSSLSVSVRIEVDCLLPESLLARQGSHGFSFRPPFHSRKYINFFLILRRGFLKLFVFINSVCNLCTLHTYTILLISNIPHHTPQNSYNQLIVNVLFLRSGRCVCGEGLADDNAFQFFLHKLLP